MRIGRLGFAAVAAAAILVAPAAGTAQVVNIDNYADNAPGTQFTERGVRFFRQADYKSAAGNFRLAARWADKLAQFNLGLMYVNGYGVERDPLRGWAWIRLSAERGYPKNVRVAEAIWNQLTDKHRTVARRILEEELEPEYGDEVAIPRTANEMKRMLARKTSGGSRVGANRAVYVADRGGNFVSGNQFFRDELWDFNKIVQFETRLHMAMGRGNVTLRELELKDDETDSDGSGSENIPEDNAPKTRAGDGQE